MRVRASCRRTSPPIRPPRSPRLRDHLQSLKQFVRRPLPEKPTDREIIRNAVARARKLIREFGTATKR